MKFSGDVVARRRRPHRRQRVAALPSEGETTVERTTVDGCRRLLQVLRIIAIQEGDREGEDCRVRVATLTCERQETEQGLVRPVVGFL